MTARRLSTNTLTLLISNLGGAFFSFLLSVLIGRALGTEGLGVYAVVMAWVFPLNLAVEFGLGTLMTRSLAQDFSAAHSYLETVMLSRLLIGGMIMLLLMAAAPLISANPQVIAGLQISAPMVIILPMFSGFTAVYKARGAMWPIPYLNIGMLIVQAALTWIALHAGGGVMAALILNLLTSAGQLVAAWGIYRWKFYVPAALSRVAPTLKPLLRQAFPFALAAVFAALQTRLSVILLERMATTSEVGYFSAASRFVEAARLIVNAYFGALFPALSALAADRLAMTRVFRRGMIGVGGFGLVAGVGFTLLALPLLRLVYGDAFAPAALVLQVLGWSLVFSMLRGGRTIYLYALGREGRVNRVNGAMIALQAGLGLLLIPALQALGAALVNLLIEITALALLWRDEMA